MLSTMRELRTAAKALRHPPQPEADPTVLPEAGVSQTRLFAIENAKRAAREALDNITANAKAAGKITVMALALTMPHQMAFLLGVAKLHLEVSRQGLESLTVIAAAILFPLMTDYLILICIRGLVARAGATSSKVWSGAALILLCGISGTINFIPDNDIVIRLIMVGAVAYIAISQILRVVGNKVDFAKVEKIENEGTAQPAAPVKAKRIVRPGQRPADKARRFAAKHPTVSVTELVKATGVSRATAKKILDELASPAKFLSPSKSSVAPVSPAPAGRR